MLIDWFTVVAQIVNFLVLVALMKRFLYGPLVAAIDAREQSIAGRLAEAAAKEQEAEARIDKLAKEAADTEREKAGALAAAREDADRQRGEILARARQNVTALETKWRDELEREKAAFFDEMRRRAAAGILDVTRSALRDLAGADLERCALNCFLAKVQSLDPGQLRALAADGITVVSRAELPAEPRLEIQHAIENRLGVAPTITFECAPAMAWGIELRGNGQRIGWTPDAYLDSLQEKLRISLDRTAAANYPVNTA